MYTEFKSYSFYLNADLLLVFILGVITAFAFPPYDYLLAAIPAFSVFLYLIFNNPSRSFLYGLLFGLGQFFFAFYWLMPSMTEFGQIPIVLAYAIFFAICLEVALFPALFSYSLSKLNKKPSLFLLLLIPSLWVLTEWLRSNMFPFAWNLIGYTFYPYSSLLQLADIGSVYLLSFLFVFFSTAITLTIFSSYSLRCRFSMFVATMLVFVFMSLYGSYKIELVNQDIDSSPALSVALVQGNIGQNEKWDRGTKDEVFDIYLGLSKELSDTVDLVVWPESSLPFFLQDEELALQKIKQLSFEIKADFFIGADTYTGEDVGRIFFNSLLMINSEQGVVSQYDKFHRVPFGEYMPLKEYLPDDLAHFSLNSGFSSVEAGKGVSILEWTNINLAPLICYESIFPRHARAQAVMGADMYINVSNDAWFGEESKSQHLLMTRLRAIENRRPLVRVSNTGITAMFDAAGNVIAMADSNQSVTLVANVPLNKSYAINTYYGQYFIVFFLLVLLLAVFFRYKDRKLKS